MSDEGDRTVDVEQIRELIDLLIEKDVAELEIKQDGVKVKIRRSEEGPAPVIAASPAVVPDRGGAEAPEGEGGEPQSVAEAQGFGDAHIVTSPIVGTFYRAPEPGTDAFVEVGDQVEEGQTLCIVEAMKLMNEIGSDVGGEVLAVFVEDAEPVEYGQQLFAIRPA